MLAFTVTIPSSTVLFENLTVAQQVEKPAKFCGRLLFSNTLTFECRWIVFSGRKNAFTLIIYRIVVSGQVCVRYMIKLILYSRCNRTSSDSRDKTCGRIITFVLFMNIEQIKTLNKLWIKFLKLMWLAYRKEMVLCNDCKISSSEAVFSLISIIWHNGVVFSSN